MIDFFAWPPAKLGKPDIRNVDRILPRGGEEGEILSERHAWYIFGPFKLELCSPVADLA